MSIKSKTKISKQSKRKTNPGLVDTILTARKNNKWQEIAGILSSPRKNRVIVNLSEINKISKDNEVIVVPGKVLSMGDLNKKVKISALDFSEKAKQKILKSGSKVSSILEEIKQNPEAKGIKILNDNN